MTYGKVDMQDGDTHSRERMRDESGQRKSQVARSAVMQFHLNSSTVANDSAEPCRKRLSVNFVG